MRAKRPDLHLALLLLALLGWTCPSLAAGPDTLEQRQTIQRNLNELGFSVGTPDGIFGPKTEAAIRQYQESLGENVTGKLTPAQIDSLTGTGTTAAADAPPAPDEPLTAFRDCPACPEMVTIPPGRFHMGATDSERYHPYIGYVPEEYPRHEVSIGYRFAIGRMEVTVAQFDAYIQATGAETGGTCGVRLPEGEDAPSFAGTRHPDADADKLGPYFVYITDGSYAQPGLPVTPEQPAVCVSRNEAKAYLEWLSQTTGRRYRLATEAEWEYAARAETGTIGSWGDDFADACEYGNFADRASDYQAGLAAPCAEAIEPLWTAEAGRYKPNPWGLHDMAGNVQEMVEDCWHGDYEGAPADGSPWRKSGCKLFIARGGDFESLYVSMRASKRHSFGYDPLNDLVQGPDEAFDIRSNIVGFRVAASLDDKAWDRQ